MEYELELATRRYANMVEEMQKSGFDVTLTDRDIFNEKIHTLAKQYYVQGQSGMNYNPSPY